MLLLAGERPLGSERQEMLASVFRARIGPLPTGLSAASRSCARAGMTADVRLQEIHCK